MAYATLAQGSSATVTFNDAADGLEVINRPSDQATITLLTGAWAYGVSPLQQNGGRRVYGLNGAGSVQITAVSGALQYEYSDNTIPYNGAGSLTSSEVGATKALVSGAGNQLVAAATAGYTTGWLNAFAFPERFGFQPAGISGTASITIDASLDGVTATQTLGVVALTSADNGKQFYTPALPVGYPYVRITVTADGAGTHAIARGV